jgi:3-oxoacyl-(acyl-carrier-protein) synthase/acyl carrier protein/NADP-dependent 3-hydroxy acid dehydrogenase YdfG
MSKIELNLSNLRDYGSQKSNSNNAQTNCNSGLTKLRILELIQEGIINADVGQILLRELKHSTAPSIAATQKAVAIVGMSGRFPDARNIEEFWKNLSSGRDSVREIPKERWDVQEHYSQDPLHTNKTYCKWGAVLDDIDQFDPAFFNMSPREARLMDPQQRLFLMEAWNALEDAGYCGGNLDGSNCDVYVGVGTGDYGKLLQQHGVPLEGYTFTGTHPAILASRLSYYLNLRGASVAVDTSCSSSLMALHLACEAIRTGKCDMALAGGAAVLVTPELYILSSKSGMLSPQGRCKTFDDGADGFVPGETVAVVVLKSLDKALRDADHIYGVIAASGTNQDGKTNGITAPSGPSQASLEVATYRQFGIDPSQISYVECHGTGTRLGDPIEIDALTQAFSQFTSKRRYCAVGSVKSNIGHTLTSAGVAGLMKVLLCMRHRQLVPSLHVEKLNRYIQFDESPFFVNTQLRDWEAEPNIPRTAAVSSFGFSGTNVHIVVQEGPNIPTRSRDDATQWRLCPVSAKTDSALKDKLTSLLNWLADGGEKEQLRDISYTLAMGRYHFPVRAAFVVRDTEELRESIQSLLNLGKVGQTNAGHIENIANDYCAGKDIDWSVFYADEHCRRISLPTYPFARERYWIPTPEISATEDPHPPVSNFKKPLESDEIIFRRNIHADEPIVSDHVVHGKPLLPAAGHLEIVHGALREMGGDSPVTLLKAIWLRPVFVEYNANIQVVLKRKQDNCFSYEVRTSSPEGAMQTHSRGEAQIGPVTTEQINLDQIRDRCSRRIEAKDLYARFKKEGIQYGQHFSTVKEIRYNGNEVFAKLMRNENSKTLPAGVIDGAIQTLAALEWDKKGVYVPFSMEKFRVLRQIPVECYVYALQKKSGGECDIFIVDSNGNPCVIVNGFSYRELKDPLTTRLYFPEWRVDKNSLEVDGRPLKRILIVTSSTTLNLDELIAQRHASAEVFTICLNDNDVHSVLDKNDLERFSDLDRIYFLGGLDDSEIDITSLDTLDRAQSHGVRSLFQLVKFLLAKGYGTRILDLKIVTNDVHAVMPGDEPRPYAGSIFGLCKSLAKEHPCWRVSCIDVSARELHGDGAEVVADRIIKEPANSKGDEVVFRGGQRYARVLCLAEVPPVSKIPFRSGGTYLILGGSGGIGSALALHLAKKVQAKIVLIGRRKRMPEIDKKITAIEAAGGEVLYLQADVTDDAGMSAAVNTVKQRFGNIHGVFHSALVLRDGLLENMDESTFEASLRPKVHGTVVLTRALQQEPVDFLVYFSSAQSFSGNPGQSNYSAACTFKDAYAVSLQKAGFPVHILNWGYWGEVGVVAKAEYRRRMRAVGVHSISVDEGMNAIEQVLAHDVLQAVPLKAERQALEKFGVVFEEQAIRAVPASLNADVSTDIQKDTVENRNKGLAQGVVIQTRVERLVAESITKTLGREDINLDIDKPLTEYGVDSIILVELVNALNENLGIALNTTEIFDYPTVRELSKFICTKFSTALPSEKVGSSASPNTAPVSLDERKQEPGGAVSQIHIEGLIGGIIAETLGRADVNLEPDKPLTEYGVDSIIIVELVNALNIRLGISLNTTEVFDHPTLSELSLFIAQELETKSPTSQETTMTLVEDPSYMDEEVKLLEQLAEGKLTIDETYDGLRLGGGK